MVIHEQTTNKFEYFLWQVTRKIYFLETFYDGRTNVFLFLLLLTPKVVIEIFSEWRFFQ